MRIINIFKSRKRERECTQKHIDKIGSLNKSIEEMMQVLKSIHRTAFITENEAFILKDSTYQLLSNLDDYINEINENPFIAINKKHTIIDELTDTRDYLLNVKYLKSR